MTTSVPVGDSPSSVTSPLLSGPSSLSSSSIASEASSSSLLHDVSAAASDEKSGTGPWGIPIPMVSMTETSGQTYGCGIKSSTDRYRRLARESMKSFLGPMPTEDFLNVFLHRDRIDRSRQPSPAGAFRDVPEKGALEKRIYEPLTKALNYRSTTNNVRRCPNFTFWDTSTYADQSGPGGVLGGTKPDICCYSDNFLHLVGSPNSKSSAKLSDMGFVAFWFEIKATEGQDFFSDPPDNTDNRDYWQFVLKGRSGTDHTTAMENLGQAANYATEACKRQHRHCCFSISLSRTSARFIRWDRAGAIVSKKFDILKQPEFLCDFLWCFAHISDVERGYDLTVGPATKQEENIFLHKITAHILTQVHVEDELELGRLLEEHAQKGSVTSIHLPDTASSKADAQKGRRLLVSRPMVVPLSFAGRGTRTYWAYDEKNDKVVFLKDTWRYDIDSEREGDILNHLNKHRVENVPEVLYHGDVPNAREVRDKSGEIRIEYAGFQTTITQDYIGADWVCGREVMDMSRIVIVKRYHYRMVLNVAGYTLLRLKGTAELLHACYDAFKASKQAYEKAKRVHRDITPGNIILVNLGLGVPHDRSRRGFLVDWDLSKDATSAGLREEHEVSATWQFLAYDVCAYSHAMIFQPESLNSAPKEAHAQMTSMVVTHHTIQHDMESMLYVVLYCALLWCDHNGDGVALRNILRGMFDYFDLMGDGKPRGGAGKLENMLNRVHTKTVQWTSRALQRWLTQVMDLHYPVQGRLSTSGEVGEMWRPDVLDTLWRKILTGPDASTLSFNDRRDILARYPGDFQGLWPHSALPLPNQPTHASPKRRRTASPDEGVPDRKRLRYSPQVEAPDDVSLVSEDTGFDIPPSSIYSDVGRSNASRSTTATGDRDAINPHAKVTSGTSGEGPSSSTGSGRTVRNRKGKGRAVVELVTKNVRERGQDSHGL